MRTLVLLTLLAAAPTAVAETARPDAVVPLDAIPALSAQDQADLLAGRGMGFAKAAEANGWPGPAHVLELAEPLELTPEQRSATEALFRRMGERARELGAELIMAERGLDDAFRNRAVDAAGLAAATTRIGALQGAVREIHLTTHLEQTALLTEAQIATYNRLRGNAAAAAGDAAQGHRHGN